MEFYILKNIALESLLLNNHCRCDTRQDVYPTLITFHNLFSNRLEWRNSIREINPSIETQGSTAKKRRCSKSAVATRWYFIWESLKFLFIVVFKSTRCSRAKRRHYVSLVFRVGGVCPSLPPGPHVELSRFMIDCLKFPLSPTRIGRDIEWHKASGSLVIYRTREDSYRRNQLLTPRKNTPRCSARLLEWISDNGFVRVTMVNSDDLGWRNGAERRGAIIFESEPVWRRKRR